MQAFAGAHRYSLEEAARILREDFFRRCREEHGYRLVATAHTLNDQAETVLMHLLSGSGLEGMAGIRLRREGIIRPLLFARRTEIEAYAREHQIAFRVDPSNQETKFVRNKIRHQLLPYLQTNFQLTDLQPFLRVGLILQDWLSYFEKELRTVLRASLIVENQNKIGLDIEVYNRYFSSFKIKLVEHILRVLTEQETNLTYQKFQGFTNWLKKSQAGRPFQLFSDIKVSREGQILWFEKLAEPYRIIDVDTEVFLNSTYRNDELQFSLRLEIVDKEQVSLPPQENVEYLDAQNLHFPLRLRNWRPGDRFQSLGMARPKKLSDFLTDEKELFFPKKQMLVLESNGDIIYVVGSRISEKYKITKRTQQALKVEVKKG